MNTSYSRPLGVTLVAILYLAIAIIALIIAARYVLNPAGNEEMILLFTRLKLPITFLNLLAVPPLINAGLATLMFRGLWEANAWSRVATVFLSFIGMLTALALIAFFLVFNFGGSQTLWASVGAFVLFTLVFIYFLKTSWPVSETEPAIAPPRDGAIRPAIPKDIPPSPSLSAQAPAVMTPVLAQPEVRHNAPTIVADAAEITGAETVRIRRDETQPPQPLACLTIISEQNLGRRFDFFGADILIGRHPTLSDVLLNDPTVSARHARIRYEEGQFALYDLESANGSFVNGQRIHSQRLQDQDKIRLGAVEMIFSASCQD